MCVCIYLYTTARVLNHPQCCRFEDATGDVDASACTERAVQEHLWMNSLKNVVRRKAPAH